ncbi:Uncharacterised protein [Achromobacter xylosoxidans]|nr:Uncharacterised protein [Achromobacter xylosoxidans]
MLRGSLNRRRGDVGRRGCRCHRDGCCRRGGGQVLGLFAGVVFGAVFQLLVAASHAGLVRAAAATTAAAAATLAFRIGAGIGAFGGGHALGGQFDGFRRFGLGIGRLLGFRQGGRDRLGQRGDHAFLFAHRRIGLAFLAAIAATATAAVAAGAGVVASGFRRDIGTVRGLCGLHCLVAFATLVAIVALAAFLAFAALAFGSAVATDVMTAAFAALGAFRARFTATVAIAVGTMAFAAAFLAVMGATALATCRRGGALGAGLFLGSGGRGLGGLGIAGQPAEQALEQAAARLRRGGRGSGRRGGGRHGRRLRGRDALDQRFGAGLDLAFARLPRSVRGRRLDQFEAGLHFFQARIVVAQALDVVMRRFQVLVGDQHQVDLQAGFHLGDVGALFVQQVGRHVDRHLGVDRRGVFLHGFFLQQAQDVQGAGFGVADHAGAVAARAGDVRAFVQGRTQALARQFHQAEARDLAHLDAGAVEMEGVTQALFDGALVLAVFHVDEVDDDQAAQVAQAQLAGHFVGGFRVGPQGGFLDVGAAGRAGRVDVHGHQRFGVVDDDGAARGQLHRARVGRFDLVFDLEAREQRDVVAVALHALDVVRHHHAHERGGLVGDLVRVDQDLADLGREVIADGADDQAGFQVDQDGRGVVARGAVDGGPELQQVRQVPLQFFDVAADAGGAGDDAHALGQLELLHRVAQFLAVLALDAARNATATGVVGHQDQVAAGQRDERGQGGALVAALFLFDLDDQFLAFAQGVLDAGGADVDAFLEEAAGHFLEGKKAMAVFAVVDEASFKAGFDPGDDTFVDVAFALFAAGSLDVEIDEFLPIDDSDA